MFEDSQIELVKMIGKGGYGTVYKSTLSDENYAVKRIEITQHGIPCLNEIYFLHHLDHPNLIKSKYIHFSKHSLYIVMDLARNDLFQLTRPSKGGTPMTGNEALKVIWELGKAIHYLHSSNVIHGDIKASNVLVFGEREDQTVKLSDFSLMSYEFNLQRNQITTLTHRAPEVLECCLFDSSKGWDRSIDMWSLGCTLHEFLTGSSFMSFQENGLQRHKISEREKFGRIKTYNAIVEWNNHFPLGPSKPMNKIDTMYKHKPVSFELDINSPIGKFVAKMLDPDVRTRMTIEEMMNDPILTRFGLEGEISKIIFPNLEETEEYKDYSKDPYVRMIAKHLYRKISGVDKVELFACLSIANKLVRRTNLEFSTVDKRLVYQCEKKICNELEFKFF